MEIRENMIKKIKTALISVSDKTNLKSLLQIFKKNNIKIISSGGTFREIKRLKFKCLEISKFTGSKEILSGNKMKEFHPGNGFRSFAAEVLPELLGPLQNQQEGVSGHRGCPIRL